MSEDMLRTSHNRV